MRQRLRPHLRRVTRTRSLLLLQPCPRKHNRLKPIRQRMRNRRPTRRSRHQHQPPQSRNFPPQAGIVGSTARPIDRASSRTREPNGDQIARVTHPICVHSSPLSRSSSSVQMREVVPLEISGGTTTSPSSFTATNLPMLRLPAVRRTPDAPPRSDI